MGNRLDRFRQVHVLVVGDVMLDRYWWGAVRRISPEAPVPVVQIREMSAVLGGAGNVAANLAGLGCRVTVLGIRGDDDAGRQVAALFADKKIDAPLLMDRGRATTTKTRIMARDQQLMRLDEEDAGPLTPEIEEDLITAVQHHVSHVDAVILSDYGKGLLNTATLCQQVIGTCRDRRIPLLVDPKGRDWQRYRGATGITPNLAELKLVAETPIEDTDAALIQLAEEVRRRYELAFLLVTLGPRGMLLSESGRHETIHTVAREVYDVSGAGDTVIATLTAGLAAGLPPREAAVIANTAAGIVVGKLGTQPIDAANLITALQQSGESRLATPTGTVPIDAARMQLNAWRSDGQRIVFTNGCFDLLHPGHIRLLHQARALGDRLVVGLNTDASVRRLKGETRPVLGEQDRGVMLNALACVDMVVLFDEDTPEALIRQLKPDILVKGADYRLQDVVGRDIVEAYGGEVKLIGLLEGYSTTGITQKVQAAPPAPGKPSDQTPPESR